MSQFFRDVLIAFERALEARMSSIGCAVHLCLGQEDVPELMHMWLRKSDWVFSTHRSHGHYLAKGGDAQALLDEIDGKETGINGGFSGSQSFCDPALRFHSTAIVGGLIGAATGAALSVKLSGMDEIVFCCIGDAATEQGVFWESLNFAALHKLPIIYICENNKLSVHAPIASRQASPLSVRVHSFGVRYREGVRALKEALVARKPLPLFVEIECERACAHVSAMEDLKDLPLC